MQEINFLFDICTMDVLQEFIRRRFQSRLGVHIVFCLVFITLFFVPVITNRNLSQTLPTAAIICSFFLATTYIGRWTCKKWLLKNQLSLFVINTILLVIFLSLLISLFIYLKGLQKQWEALSVGTPLVVLFLALGVFLAFSREALRVQMKNAEIADQQKQSELELLRSQLSPHFLFNTLNNLYGLSITQHEKIPSLIVKLSELLRYSVYEAKQAFVPLADEIAYIRNYIEMEQIRMGDRLNLTVNIEEGSKQNPRIAPMLLIVFIENAFKHSKNSYNLAVEIDIDLKVIDDTIFFVIKNTCGEKPVINKYQERNSGIGLANTVRRLQLLYPGESMLEQRREKDIYHLSLQLKVK